MAVQITIRGVPEEVRDELAARAALKRQSMQEYLREELERLAALPSIETVLEEVGDGARRRQTPMSLPRRSSRHATPTAGERRR